MFTEKLSTNKSFYNWPQVPGLCRWRTGGNNIKLPGKGMSCPLLQSISPENMESTEKEREILLSHAFPYHRQEG